LKSDYSWHKLHYSVKIGERLIICKLPQADKTDNSRFNKDDATLKSIDKNFVKLGRAFMETTTYMPFGEFAKRVFLLAGLVIGILAMWQLRLVLLMTFLAVIIAVSLDIPVRELQRRGFPRSIAIALVISSTILLLGLLGFVIGAPVVEQTQNLFEELPDALDRVVAEYNHIAEDWAMLPQVGEEQLNEANDPSGLITPDTLTGGALFVTSIGSFVVSFAVNLVLVIIASIYLLADPDIYANSILALIPKNRQEFMLRLLIDLRRALVAWLITQLFSMTIITVLLSFTLGVIWGVPNAIALGILAGVLTIIPNFGSIIAAIPGIIFTLADRPNYIVPVILTYVITQQLESNFITPFFIKRRLQVPAAALLVFQVMVGVLFGFLGLLLAVPMFMVVLVLVRYLYVDSVLDNLNTEIEARETESGIMLSVTNKKHRTQEVPLRQIFDNDEPMDLSLRDVLRSISMRRESNNSNITEQEMQPIDDKRPNEN